MGTAWHTLHRCRRCDSTSCRMHHVPCQAPLIYNYLRPIKDTDFGTPTQTHGRAVDFRRSTPAAPPPLSVRPTATRHPERTRGADTDRHSRQPRHAYWTTATAVPRPFPSLPDLSHFLNSALQTGCVYEAMARSVYRSPSSPPNFMLVMRGLGITRGSPNLYAPSWNCSPQDSSVGKTKG